MFCRLHDLMKDFRRLSQSTQSYSLSQAIASASCLENSAKALDAVRRTFWLGSLSKLASDVHTPMRVSSGTHCRRQHADMRPKEYRTVSMMQAGSVTPDTACVCICKQADSEQKAYHFHAHLRLL